jgi:hypothetical protein
MVLGLFEAKPAIPAPPCFTPAAAGLEEAKPHSLG